MMSTMEDFYNNHEPINGDDLDGQLRIFMESSFSEYSESSSSLQEVLVLFDKKVESDKNGRFEEINKSFD